MKSARDDLLALLRDFKKTPEYAGLRLRLEVSHIVVTRLRDLGWSQRELARRCKQKESFISRIVHGDANCTLDTIGKLAYALGIDVAFVEIGRASCRERV